MMMHSSTSSCLLDSFIRTEISLTAASKAGEVGTAALHREQQRVLHHLLRVTSRLELSAQTVLVHGLHHLAAARRWTARVRAFHRGQTRHEWVQVAGGGICFSCKACHDNQHTQPKCNNIFATHDPCHFKNSRTMPRAAQEDPNKMVAIWDCKNPWTKVCLCEQRRSHSRLVSSSQARDGSLEDTMCTSDEAALGGDEYL